MKLKFRDLIAFPFSFIAFIFIMLSLFIGSSWTAIQWRKVFYDIKKWPD